MISTILKDYLDTAGVPYAVHSHPLAYTSQEVAQRIHIPGSEMVKLVILKTDRGQLIMAVLSANEVASLDVLRDNIKCQALRLATEGEFRDIFPTCEPGAIPALGNIFGLPVYCDTALSRNHEIEFNAGTHRETIRMRFDDYVRLVKPQMLRFAQPYSEGRQRVAA